MENFKAPEKIQKMFDEIAQKYDFNNMVISLGLHKKIKKSVIKNFELSNQNFPSPFGRGIKGEGALNKTVVLDLCCGTGDISKFLSEKGEVKKVIGLDFSKNMLEIAKKKNSSEKIEYIYGDCIALPFEDNSFDAVTMCFGLRNIENVDKALEEVKRVLKPNGLFLHMDFAKGNRFLDKLFDFFIPILVKIFYKNTVPYEYLVKSKQEFYTPKEIENVLKSKNMVLKKEKNYLFNVISAQIFTNVF